MGVIEVVTETAVELCRWKDSQKGERREDGTSVGVFTELNRRIMLVARGTASEMARVDTKTNSYYSRKRSGANGSQFEQVRGPTWVEAQKPRQFRCPMS
jgi:hypothetical protein